MTLALLLLSIPLEAEGRILGWEWSYCFTAWGVNAYVERDGHGLPNTPWWPMSPISELGRGR
jgi:hypothetical protein